MNRERERQIIDALWAFYGESMPATKLDEICKDNHEKKFAINKLRGMGISLKYPRRNKEFSDKANREFKSRRELEKELTIQRKRERQHKKLFRS